MVKELDKKADVYSFAISMWEVMSRRRIWTGEKLDLIEIQARVMRGQRPDIDESMRKDYPALVKVIETGWLDVPFDRPTFEVICGIIGAGVATS